MIGIKKVQVTPVTPNTGDIIDSFSTLDDKTTNAPSINAVENYVSATNYTKTECDAKYKINDDFAVIMGNYTVTAAENDNLYAYTTVNYPQGFNSNNCCVISLGLRSPGGDTVKPFAYGTASLTEARSRQNATIGKAAMLKENDITLLTAFEFSGTHSELSFSFEFKLVLMKLDLDVSAYELGDVNMDGEVTQPDLTLVQNYITGDGTLNGKQFKLGDMNADGMIDTADTLALARKIQGD